MSTSAVSEHVVLIPAVQAGRNHCSDRIKQIVFLGGCFIGFVTFMGGLHLLFLENWSVYQVIGAVMIVVGAILVAKCWEGFNRVSAEFRGY